MTREEIFAALGLDAAALAAADSDALAVRSPIDGAEIARLGLDTEAETDAKIAKAAAAFDIWRATPPPRRGELIRLLGNELRAAKEPLGRLVSIESGKILAEGLGEVQEMIDICDFAVGLSRQLYGLTIASERPGHRMMETWHPLGPVGVISAFNFPAAVWAWNFAIAIVCGDPVVWKPSEKTPLTALACQGLYMRAAERFQDAPDGMMQVVIGGADAGKQMVGDTRLPLISATGSCRMGATVGPAVAARFGRSLLELGGNNAMIVTGSADLELAVRAILFAAAGTAGQRCTTLRRLIVHQSIRDNLTGRLQAAYADIAIGDPLQGGILVGPLIDKRAFDAMQDALARAAAEGGVVTGGERLFAGEYPDAYYVRPAIVEMPGQTDLLLEETFAPVLYVLGYEDLKDAIRLHNASPQGLASSIFTTDMREAEYFLSAEGSDCGIANVNIGPSGAEIGGAFGGEKETRGGRESGSDAWRAYMRRATNTINYSSELPLAQGIRFEV
ncbi:MAG: aldehyde dehydrogenase family protein [Rhodospirillales bacterium]|nr:aldehyde dehydrogenase family protein [Rhodospirillales bacterium]